MEDPSIRHNARSLTREQAIKQSINILSERAQFFKIASDLCMEAGKAIRDSKSRKLSQNLTDEAMQWLGACSNVGRRLNFERIDIEQAIFKDHKVLSAAFSQLCSMLGTRSYELKALSVILSLSPNKEMLTNILNTLSSAQKPYLKPLVPEQTEEEKQLFGEFPLSDWNGMLVQPIQDALDLLIPFASPLSDENIEITDIECKEKIPQYIISSLLIRHDKLYDATFQHQGETFNTNVICEKTVFQNPIAQVDCVYSEAVGTFYRNYRDPKKRKMYLDHVLNTIEQNTQKFIEECDAISQIKSIQKIMDTLPSIQTKKKKRKKKKATAQISIPQQDNLEPAEDPIKLEPQKLDSIPSSTSESEYVWDVDAFKKECDVFAAKKAMSAQKEVVSIDTPKYQNHIPSMTKAVVEKFLDIFGSQQADQRRKNKSASYQRQGWGTIQDLKYVLTHAGWLFDDTTGSSSIRFSMPDSSHAFNAAILKLHNDHGVGHQNMREITRHFIIKGLELAGYHEDFLTHYYNHHFIQKKQS